MHLKRTFISDLQSIKCFFRHSAKNHSTSTALVLRANACRVCYTNDAMWVAGGAAVMPALVPIIGVEGGGGGSLVAATSPPITATPLAAAGLPPEPDYAISFTPVSALPAASVLSSASFPSSAISRYSTGSPSACRFRSSHRHWHPLHYPHHRRHSPARLPSYHTRRSPQR